MGALGFREIQQTGWAQLTRRFWVCKPVWVTTYDVEAARGAGFRTPFGMLSLILGY